MRILFVNVKQVDHVCQMGRIPSIRGTVFELEIPSAAVDVEDDLGFWVVAVDEEGPVVERSAVGVVDGGVDADVFFGVFVGVTHGEFKMGLMR